MKIFTAPTGAHWNFLVVGGSTKYSNLSTAPQKEGRVLKQDKEKKSFVAPANAPTHTHRKA